MNLNELFPKQKRLDAYIVEEKNLGEQDLLQKKIVALICELYECVNEARFFKFWSEDQRPNRTGYIGCDTCTEQPGKYEVIIGDELIGLPCPKCDGHEEVYVGNRLLEEYVDTIHFALSIANELEVNEHKYIKTEPRDLNRLVIGITNIATVLSMSRSKDHVKDLLNSIIALGYQFGFDEETVIKAYDAKNAENYKRQKVGY